MIDNMDRRSMLQAVIMLAGVTAAPAAAAKTLFTGPQSLPADTMLLLTAVADTIIPATDTPGAVAAGVPASFGKLIANWASPDQRTKLLGALQAIDTQSGGFAKLSPAKRFDMLSAHDRANAADLGYAQLKDLLVTLYYLTEIGCTVELRYEHVPGAWEPSLPVTAETRTWGGPAAF
jgi:hypothetical protein